MKTIVIFVKAPRPGRVKTRLAAGLGVTRATELYKAMAIDTLSVARTVRGANVLIAYDGSNPHWLSRRPLQWFKQRGNSLGERLIHASARTLKQTGGPLLVIGSDLPALTSQLLASGFQALKRVDIVIGPSFDGGYYLIGFRSLRPQLFRKISWSTSWVTRQTIANVKRLKFSYHLLPKQRDLDTMTDLKALVRC